MPKYLPPPHKFRPKTLDSTDTVDFTHFRLTVNRYCVIIWTLTECFPVHFKYICKFSIKNITIWHFYSNLSTPAIFFEETEPLFVMIHNISIATDDVIIQVGDDVNIFPVYLSRAIIIWGNCLSWLEKTIVSDYISCQFLVSWFGNSLMATECTLPLAYLYCKNAIRAFTLRWIKIMWKPRIKNISTRLQIHESNAFIR